MKSWQPASPTKRPECRSDSYWSFVYKNEKTLLDQRPKVHDSNFAKSVDFGLSKFAVFKVKNHGF